MLPRPFPPFLRLVATLRRGARRFAPAAGRAGGAGIPAEVRVDLMAALPEFEGNCLAVVERVEFLDRGSRQLVAESRTLLEIARGRDADGSLAQATLGVLAAPLRYLDEWVGRQDQLIALLRQCEEQTRRMLEVRRRMHETLAPLACMTFFFKIESASLAEAHRETFLNVTAEIDRMRRLVDESFAANAELLAATHDTLRRVRESLQRDLAEQSQHITARRRTIDATMRALDEQLAANSARDAELHAQSEAIAGDVARIVGGLQFQDIVQQKCEHIVSAIEELTTQPILSAAGTRLQALQLAGAADDLKGGHQAARASLARIIGHIGRVQEGGRRLDEVDGMTSQSDGMVRTLLVSLDEVHGLLRRLTDLIQRTHEAVTPAGGLAGNISSTLGELALQIRLIALNAQIRSLQIGEGTGLEVLAARTAAISGEINLLSDESARNLTLLRQAIEEMLRTFGAARESGHARIADLEQARPLTEQRLQAVRGRARTAAAAIATTAGELLDSARGAEAAIGAFPQLESVLAEASATLLAIAAAAGDAAGEPEAGGATTQRYTMASEREIHARLAEAAAPATPAPGAPGRSLTPVAVPASAPGAEIELF